MLVDWKKPWTQKSVQGRHQPVTYNSLELVTWGMRIVACHSRTFIGNLVLTYISMYIRILCRDSRQVVVQSPLSDSS